MTAEADNVSEDPTLPPVQLVAAETTVRTVPLENTEHVRIGGQPGLRVQHLGGVHAATLKRVTAGNDEPSGVTIPMDVVRQVRDALANESADTAAITVKHVRGLLKPFLR